MKASVAIEEAFSHWIDSVGDTVATLLGRLAPPRTVRLSEDGDGIFVVQADEETAGSNLTGERIRIVDGQIDHNKSARLAATLSGSRVELMLQSERFIFRPLELPSRATEFMHGIVRSQIDRLTPWNAADAAFGWSKPAEADADRMVITIVATPLALVTPYVRAIAGIGAQSIAVFTNLPDAGSDAIPIKVWEEKARGVKETGRIRQALVIILAAAGVTAAVALGANAILRTSLTAQQDELARQIGGGRAAAGVARNNVGSITTARGMLERRKYEAPATVLALEALSKILPDHTHVTELRVEGNKLHLTGITRDAPSLIGLIEQSGRFTHATFFAPTTRLPSDPGDRFHIEAVIQALGSPSS